MASLEREMSKSDLNLSGDLSSETSLQTDTATFGLSYLDIDDDFAGSSKRSRNNSLKSKQLLHDVQLLKIELAQKDVLVNNMKFESTTKVEGLEERLNEALHQNKVLATRLNSIVEIHEEETKRRQEQIKAELARILLRQKELEENNERFMKNENELKKELKYLELSDQDYEIISKRDEDMITIREFVTVRVYQLVKPLRVRLEETLKQNKYLDEALSMNRNELMQLKHNHEEEKRRNHSNTIDSQKLYYELADTKALLQQANFKRDNYDKARYERDEFERKYMESEKNMSTLSATHNVLLKERDDLFKEISQYKQETVLLKQDKDYFNRQFVDAQNKAALFESKMDQLATHLEEAKKAREEIYEKYVNSKEIYKNEYDNKLSRELENLKAKTQFELEKLRSSTRDFYERENQAFKEARDNAIADKEKAESSEKEIQRKYNELMNELRVGQLNNDSKLNELKAEQKLKSFELDRANLLNEECAQNLKKCILDNEKLSKKVEVVQNEYYALQVKNDKNLLELENELNEKRVKLDNYEKLEREMDEVIMQAAESENTEDAEKMLFSYGYGANIVTSAKRRIQQNVHLTRRILHLEKLNTSLRHEIEREHSKIREISEELDQTKALIEQSKQPQEYLISSMQSKDTQIRKQKSLNETLQKKINELEAEKENLLKGQNEMSSDIERLLRHNEELFLIRDELLKNGININLKKPMKPVVNHNNQFDHVKSKIIADSLDALSCEQPEPMMFTKFKQNHPQARQLLHEHRSRKAPELQKKVYSIDKH